MEIRYQEVVDNLAVVAANPDTLPSLAIVADGVTTVADTTSLDAKTLWTRAVFKGFSSETLTPGFSRNPTPQWTLEPLTDYEKLEAAWYALRVALGHRPEPCSPGEKRLKSFQIDGHLANLPCGWLHVGSCKDVPLGAAYRAHRGTVWVWVNPDGMAGLSALTLVILDIGTAEVNSLAEIKPEVKIEITGTDNIQNKMTITKDKQQVTRVAGSSGVDISIQNIWPEKLEDDKGNPVKSVRFWPSRLDIPMQTAEKAVANQAPSTLKNFPPK